MTANTQISERYAVILVPSVSPAAKANVHGKADVFFYYRKI